MRSFSLCLVWTYVSSQLSKLSKPCHDRVLDVGLLARKVPVPCCWNWAPTRSMYVRIEEAVRRAVERDEPLPGRDVVEQRLLLLGADPRLVGVDHQARVVVQRSRLEVAELVGVDQLDPALGEHRLQLAEPGRRLVVAVVAQEQQLERRSAARQWPARRVPDRQRDENQTEKERATA